MTPARRDKAIIGLCYAMVYVVWGSTYFFIKAAVETIPAPLVVSIRFLSGAVIIAALALRAKAFKNLPSFKEILGSAALGVLLLLLGNGLITIAEKIIPSYAASLIVACMPIYVALFNLLLYRAKISAVRFGGVVVGVAGIAVLLYNGTSIAGSLGPAVLIAVLGVLSWGFGTSAAKALPKAKDVFISTMIQMLVAGIASFSIGIINDPSMLTLLSSASAWSFFSVGYLAVFGSLTLVAYNHLLANEPSFRISSYSLVNPLIAVLLGLASGERATPYLFFGFPLVLAGLSLMLYGDELKRKLKERRNA